MAQQKATSPQSYRMTFPVMAIIVMTGLPGILQAQSFQRITHSGIELSTGINGFCNYALAQGELRGITRGVKAGFVTGNNLLRFRISPFGYYRSTSARERKFAVLHSDAMVNFYPLEFMRTSKQVIDIYATVGVSFQNIGFDDRNDYKMIVDANEEMVEFQKLGRVSYLNEVAGVGLEFHSTSRYLHVFSEILFSNTVFATTDNYYFESTWSKSRAVVNIGIRIATAKKVKTPKAYPG